MKMIKALLLWMLLTLVSMTPAAAQTVELAAQPLDPALFEHYPSFVQTEGEWSVNAIQADALLERFWSVGSKTRTEMCVFHTALEGNAQTGIWTPVLRFYYIDGPKAINARAVSVLADGMRYDFAASSSTVSRGKATAELITAPLTADAASAVQAISAAENVSIRLLGDEVYTAKLDPAAKAERGVIEAASLIGLNAGFTLLQDAGLAEYALWDLSADAWESAHGYRPAFAMSEVTAALRDTAVMDDFGMVMLDDRGAAAQTAQAILLESGFLNEKASTIFTESAVDAVLRAQQYLGLIETGCMDAQLEQALAAGRSVVPAGTAELRQLGQTAEVGLDRYWFAHAVSASSDLQSQRAVVNTDNVFLAADGSIRNLSAAQLHLFMQMQASVICNGSYAYEANLVCECSEGTALDTLLLPLAQARLIVYAEVPAQLAQDSSVSWTIQLAADGETLEFELQ